MKKDLFIWKIYYLCELYHSYLTTDDETIKEEMLTKFLQEKETLVNLLFPKENIKKDNEEKEKIYLTFYFD